MRRRSISTYLLWFIGCAAWVGAIGVREGAARLELWPIGGEDRSWGAWGTLTALDDTARPGAIQPTESHGEINIMRIVSWNPGKPKDFEEGNPQVWDNAAIVGGDPLVLVDGDPTTSTEDRFKRIGANQTGRTFFLDLGAPFSADRVVFYPRQEGKDEEGRAYREDYMRGYELFVNDGSPESFVGGQPTFRSLRSNRRNRASVVDVRFSLQPVRILKLRSTSPSPFEIAEVEMYGTGFASEATYLSNVIDLEGLSNFGRLDWVQSTWRRSGDVLELASDASASATVMTRSGDDPTPVVYHEIVGGEEKEVTEEQYNKLLRSKKGSITDDVAHWSLWSLPHSIPGERIASPGPRRYFQFLIAFKSASVHEMVRMDSLAFQFATPPVADTVMGEVALLDDPTPKNNIASVTAGESATFTYDLRAAISPGQTGFDGLEMTAPSPAVFRELLMGEPLEPVTPDEIDSSEPNRVRLLFPSHKISDGTPLRVVFDTSVLVFGTSLVCEVFDSSLEELPQLVVPGNANDAVSTDDIRILVSKASLGEFLAAVQVRPSTITPNEDGINDASHISYTLLQLVDEAPVRVMMYDLSGAVVRKVYVGKETNGQYDRPSGMYRYKTWDGRDDEGALVPPGLYVYKISVETDVGAFDKVGTLAVVY